MNSIRETSPKHFRSDERFRGVTAGGFFVPQRGTGGEMKTFPGKIAEHQKHNGILLTVSIFYKR